jgi:flagellar hook-basal body complex protein FliE
MSDPLSSIRFTQPLEIADTVSLGGAAKAAAKPDFAGLLEQAVSRVDHTQKDAQVKVDRFMKGEDQELHEVALSLQRSELTFDYFMQVRNKVVQAYQEIMRMQM